MVMAFTGGGGADAGVNAARFDTIYTGVALWVPATMTC